MENQKISIASLRLRNQNPRFPDKYFNKSEKELIKYICENKDFKIEELARSIVEDRKLLQLENMVVYKDQNEYIVIEGNRRLVVYKLLQNPDLLEKSLLKEKIIAWSREYPIGKSFLVDCIVSINMSDCQQYVERKHMNGNNEVNWGEQERTHYNYRIGKANNKEKFKAEVAKTIKQLDMPDLFKEQVLGVWCVTNLRRIIDSSVARDEYGISIDVDGNLKINDPDFSRKLKIIIWNVLEKKDFQGNKLNSRTLNSNTQIKEYLKSITLQDEKRVDQEIINSKTVGIFWDHTIKIQKNKRYNKIYPKSTSRCYLIPKTCMLNIENPPKINNIYRELRDNLLLDDTKNATPNAVAVLFRVFLETSLDFFWEKKNWKTFNKNEKMSSKVSKITDFMEREAIATKAQLTAIKRVVANNNHFLSINDFHSYVHSYKTQPTSSDLKVTWDNLEEFFNILRNSFKYL